jgi:PAS domain S-box-containing protein
MNAVAESLTGWKSEEATGQQLDTVFRIVNAETRQPVQDPAKKAMSEGVIIGLANHTALITKGGNELPIDDSAAPIRCAKGEVVNCVLVFRDVTERRQAERVARSLASIVESSNDAIIGKDMNGVITSWNRAAERLFGYSAVEAIGRPIAMLAPPDRADEMPGILQRIRRGERVDHFDTVRRANGGRLIPISLTVSPIKDEDGEVVGASKIARDVSERKRAEEALREADRNKDELLAMLAHELRNPLAPIRNAIQFLQMQGPDEPVLQKARDIIDCQAQHMSRLVDDLLDVSRISRGKINLQKQQTSLSPILINSVEVSRPLIEAKGHELTMKLPPERVYLEADTTRLAQVFLNLLNNAAKYTEPGGHIWLTAERQGSDVVVKVKDNGTGIAADKLPMLFGMYSQVGGSSSRSQGGLGIGLHLVKRLVEMHGGSVVAHNEGQGKGSEFIVRLPVFVETSVPLASTKEDELAIPKSTLRIFIVDDNRDSADTLGMVLRLMGNDIRTAYDGEEAVALAGEFRPDVVLLDIGLPKLNGYEACRRIREQPWGKNMVLIAVTGWGQEEDRRLSHEAGFDKHMVKPVDPQGLIKLLGELCGVKAS